MIATDVVTARRQFSAFKGACSEIWYLCDPTVVILNISTAAFVDL